MTCVTCVTCEGEQVEEAWSEPGAHEVRHRVERRLLWRPCGCIQWGRLRVPDHGGHRDGTGNTHKGIQK